jgi:hypothetical protein
MPVTIPAGINVTKIERGMDPAELVTALNALIAKGIDAYVVADKNFNLSIESATDGIIGRIEFRNDLGLTDADRLCL